MPVTCALERGSTRPPAVELGQPRGLASFGPVRDLLVSELADPVELLVATSMASSKSDARRLLQQGSVRANGAVVPPDQGLDPAARFAVS